MRVVGGSVKGHALRAPKGTETRPTTDKVREAVFAMLTGEYEDDPVLDLFAGTGAMGIEALSRGASTATFVERRREACSIIGANLTHTKLQDRATVLCMPFERAIGVLREPFGLVVLDPPYAMPNLHDIMATVGNARVISDDTVVVFEHSPRFAVQARYARLVLQRQKVYGDTAVSIFVVQEEKSE